MSHFISAVGDVITFVCQTSDPATSADTNADAPPTYAIYEEETSAAIATGTMALLGALTGYYTEQITLAAGTGYERLKTYQIRISAVVGGTTGSMSHIIQMTRVMGEELGIIERGEIVSIGVNSARLKAGTVGAKAGDLLYFTAECTTAASRYMSTEIASYTPATETVTVDPHFVGGTPAGTIQYWIIAGPPALADDAVDADVTQASFVRWLNTLVSTGNGNAGTIGKLLIDAATAAADPLANTPATYSAGQVGALVGAINSLVTVVKAKTDLLAGDGQGNINANIERINNVQLTGDGTTTPMGG